MKKRFLSMIMTLCLVLSLLPAIGSGAFAASDAATVQIGSGEATGYASFEAAWNAAIAAKTSTGSSAAVKLLTDVTAAADSGFGTGDGFDAGSILLPSGHTVILDLNGHTLDRGKPAKDASVVKTAGYFALKDTSESAAGKLTGAGGSAAAIAVSAGYADLQSGSITGNSGAGASVSAGAKLDLRTRISITGNGSGVSAVSGAYLFIGGRAVISGNGSSGAEKNVCLAEGAVISPSDSLYDGANVGVTAASVPASGSPVAVSEALTNDCSTFFHSDNAAYRIVSGGNVLYLSADPVAFDARNGTLATMSADKPALPADPAWRTGYTFSGWYTGIDGTGSRISSAADAARLPAGTTVYARWTDGTQLVRTRSLDFQSKTLKYVANGAAEKSADPTAASITDSAEGWSYTAGSSTLTLSGAIVDTADAMAISLPDHSTLVLADGSKNAVRSGSGNLSLAVSAYTPGSDNEFGLAIRGGGALDAEAGKSIDKNAYSAGIYASGPITVSSGTITAVAGQASNYSGGIFSSADAVTINGGTVTAKGGKTVSGGMISAGIAAGADFAMNGGTLTAAGYSDNTYSYGVASVGGNIKFTGGSSTVSGSSAALAAQGSQSISIGKPKTLTPAGAAVGKTATANGKSQYMTLLGSDGKTAATAATLVYVNGSGAVLPFTDVAKDNWAYSAVDYVYTNELFSGTTATSFSPSVTMTRGMLVTVLYRLAGKPAVTAGSSFSDVAAGTYYTDAVAWASANKLVTGYGNGRFAPNATVTREQMAAILYRYAQLKGYDVSIGEETNIRDYTDVDEISQYAVPALQWACGAQLVNGVDGKLLPASGAQRDQVAAILMRFCCNVVK